MKRCNENVDAACVLCQEPLETRNHLFFDCPYLLQIWEALMKGVLKEKYVTGWERIIDLVTREANWSKVQLFVARYMLQSMVHTIWMERNRRRHGEVPCTATLLIKRLDKNMRNKITILQRKGSRDLGGAMVYWFETRQN